jgi:hypothetical protein
MGFDCLNLFSLPLTITFRHDTHFESTMADAKIINVVTLRRPSIASAGTIDKPKKD